MMTIPFPAQFVHNHFFRRRGIRETNMSSEVESYIQLTNYVTFFTSHPLGVLLGGALFALGLILGFLVGIAKCCKSLCRSSSKGIDQRSSSKENIISLEVLPDVAPENQYRSNGAFTEEQYRGIPRDSTVKEKDPDIRISIDNEISIHDYDLIAEEEDTTSLYKNVTADGQPKEETNENNDEYDYENVKDIVL